MLRNRLERIPTIDFEFHQGLDVVRNTILTYNQAIFERQDILCRRARKVKFI